MVVSTVMWGSRKTLVPPLMEDCTEPASCCWSNDPMLLAMLSWEWVSSAIVLKDTSELCRRGLLQLSFVLLRNSFFS